MKKKVWVPALIILFALALFASFATFSYRQSIVINQPIYDVSSQFNKLQNWKNWHTGFGSNDPVVLNNQEQQISLPGEKKYDLQVLNPTAVKIYTTENEGATSASLTAIPYKDGSSTYVEWNEKLPGYAWIKRKLLNHDAVKESLNNLKSFLEDDGRKYGFPIKIIPVKDTLIVTKVITVTPGEINKSISILFNQLRDYIISNHILKTADFYFVTSTPVNDGKKELAVGIPVHAGVAYEDGFKFLKLPATGRLLQGVYKGSYSGKQKLYDAMEKYIMDKKLKKVALPLEKYNDTFTQIEDSSQVIMTLLYPVY